MRRHDHYTQVPECAPHHAIYFRVLVMADFMLCAFCHQTRQPSNVAQSTEPGFSPLVTWMADSVACTCLPPFLLQYFPMSI